MHDTDEQIRSGLRRITECRPVDHTRVWQELLGRRRHRHRRRIATTALAGVALVTIVVVGISRPHLGDGKDSDVVASNMSAESNDPGVTNQQTNADLLGRTFAASGLVENGEPRPLVADTRISISFLVDPSSDTARISWTAGCNSGTARLLGTESTLQLDEVGSTLMRCPEQIAEQDQWLWDFLTSHPSWTLDGDTLILSTGKNVLRLTENG